MSMLGAGNVRVRAADWNKAVSDCGRLVPKAGRGILVDRTPDGSSISADPLFGWRHPWNTVARWREGAWHLNINPGFVNGDPVFVVGTVGTKKTVVENQVNRPITVTVGGITRTVTETVTERTEVYNENDLELTEVPWWKVAGTRSVVDDVPAFFVPIGVVSQPQLGSVTTANFDRINLGELAAKASGSRLLRSVDVVAIIYRPQFRSTFEVSDASGTTGGLLQYAPAYDFSSVIANGPQARLVQEAPYVPQKTPDILLRALGVEPDTDQDKILLATVYFLSPEGSEATEIDEQWTPFVKHHVFWNLMHATKNVIPELPSQIPTRPPFFTGLAGGYGDMLINQFNSLKDTIEREVLNFYRQDESGGAFWST